MKRIWFVIILALVYLGTIYSILFYNQKKENITIQPELIEIKNTINKFEINDSLLLSDINSLSNLVKKGDDSAAISEKISDIKTRLDNSKYVVLTKLIEDLETKIVKININSKVSTKEFLEIVISWPFIIFFIFLALIYFNFNIIHLRGLFGRVKSISIMGNSVEFSEEMKINTESSIKEYRSTIKELFNAQIQKEKLSDKLRYLVDEIEEYLSKNNIYKKTNSKFKPDFRCTIHIPDALFEDTLYQLLNYYPNKYRGGIGRIKSIRFGIIGLAWRLEESSIRGNVSNSPEVLIENWGMDKSETSTNTDKKAFASIVIKLKDDTRLAVIYFDSNKEYLFGSTNKDEIVDIDIEKYKLENKKEILDFANKFKEKVIKVCSEKNITSSLENIRNHYSDKYLQIRLFEKYD